MVSRHRADGFLQKSGPPDMQTLFKLACGAHGALGEEMDRIAAHFF